MRANSFSFRFIMLNIFLSVSRLFVELKSFQVLPSHWARADSSGLSFFFPGRKKGSRLKILYLEEPIVNTSSTSAISSSGAN